MTKLFPADGENMSSEAKPEIWSDWDDFAEQAERLETLAGGLEAAADWFGCAGVKLRQLRSLV
jgi:cytochrome c556